MNNSQEPPLCANGCGFFGNPTTRNLCSKCYNDFLKRTTTAELESALQRLKLSSSVDQPKTNPIHTESSSLSVIEDDDDNRSTKKVIKKRCGVCKKRVGLIGFTCQCRGVFCGAHRHPEDHSCAADSMRRRFEDFSKGLFDAAVKADKLPHRL